MSLTPEQEKALFTIAEKFDLYAKQFIIGVETKTAKELRWYTPQAFAMRMLRIGAGIAPAEVQLVLGALHGCIDLFGFGGTLKLALKTRRLVKNGNTRTKKT